MRRTLKKRQELASDSESIDIPLAFRCWVRSRWAPGIEPEHLGGPVDLYGFLLANAGTPTRSSQLQLSPLSAWMIRGQMVNTCLVGLVGCLLLLCVPVL